MSKEFEDYKTAAVKLVCQQARPAAAWLSVYDWYRGGGRQQFMDAFTKETAVTFGNQRTPDDLVAMAIPKSYGDLDSKVRDDAFYRAHAAWFLEEMDHITGTVPKDANDPAEAAHFAAVLRFTNKVLLDSIVLFDNWSTYRAGVPGVYGIGKVVDEHIMAFYQGARQTIYDHGSWGLSFSDNHSDTATAIIRQAVEIRLRRAFGIMGKIRKSDDSIHPIPLNDLLDAINAHKTRIQFPVRFENIIRMNGWANMYLHSALKLYAWCPPRSLAFLREFLLGKAAPGYSHHSNAGIILDQGAFDAVRDRIRQKHAVADFDLQLPDAAHCDVLIQ